MLLYAAGAVSTLAFLSRIPGHPPAKVVWSAAWPALWIILLVKYAIKGDV